MISVDSGTTATYVYNALGERVEKDVGGTYTEYVFDKDGNPLGENNRTSWTDTWVDCQGMHIAHYENGETYLMHANRIGTTTFVTDYSGAVVQDELHYPWGQEWAISGSYTEERYAELHHRDPETDVDPTHFRMYSSGTYRWFTPDPLQADIFHPQSMSGYTYANGNSLNNIDPFGLCGEADIWYPATNHLVGFPLCSWGAAGGSEISATGLLFRPGGGAGGGDVPLNPYATAIFTQVGEETGSLLTPQFYLDVYGEAALAGAGGDFFVAYGPASEAGSAWLEGTVPGSVMALTNFISGLKGDPPTSWAGAAGYAAGRIAGLFVH